MTNGKMRDSNIELGRIVCMLMIICHHMVGHGGGCGMEPCLNKWIAYFFLPGGKICFDTFIAISCYFLVDQKFKSTRFVKMYLEVLFYSVVTMLLALALGAVLNGKEIFSAFLPITGGVQGYAQTYLAFYLLLPFLSKISNSMTKGQNQFILVVLTVFCIIFRVMSSLVWSEQSIYCRVILFIYIYFIMLYVKRNPIKILGKWWLMLATFIVGWMLAFMYFVGTTVYPDLAIWQYIGILFVDEGGLVFLIAGLAFFFFFKNIKMKNSKVINHFGGTTFAVILIHDGHFFRNYTWQLLRTSEWFYSKIFGIRVILSAILIYVICSIIDDVRKILLEKPIFNTNSMKKFCSKFNHWIEN